MGIRATIQYLGLIPASIFLALFNTFAMLGCGSQNPLVSPHFSGIILTLAALVLIRNSRQDNPFNLHDILALFVIYAPLFAPVFVLLGILALNSGLLYLILWGLLIGIYNWLPTLGAFYLPGALSLLVLCWQRTENLIQKSWLLAGTLTIVICLLYDLWWFWTGQKIQVP